MLRKEGREAKVSTFGHLCPVQHSTVQYSMLQYNTAQYSTVQNVTAQYSTVQHSTVYYVTVQHIMLQYSVVQYVTVQPSPTTLCSIRSFSNVCVRQGSAVLCSVMQCCAM